jgi:hypothetical protein
MNKQHILDEIRRTANENGGTPLAVDRFFTATGIKLAGRRSSTRLVPSGKSSSLRPMQLGVI